MDQSNISTIEARDLPTPTEQRKLKRYNVRLKVFDQHTDEMIGYIEDINIQGMNLKSQKALPEMQNIDIYFGTDENEPGSEKI